MPSPCTVILSPFCVLQTGQPEVPGEHPWGLLPTLLLRGLAHLTGLFSKTVINGAQGTLDLPLKAIKGTKPNLTRDFCLFVFASALFSAIKSLFRPGPPVSRTSPIPHFTGKLQVGKSHRQKAHREVCSTWLTAQAGFFAP